jgi:hypothetical protein
MGPRRYSDGQPFLAGRSGWPEAIDLSISGDVAELRIFRSHVTHGQIHAIRNGSARFGWIDGYYTAVLCFSFATDEGEQLPWSAVCFHAGRELDTVLPGTVGTSICATVVLTDASDGLVKATCVMTWPADASDSIRATISRHLSTRLDLEAEQAVVRALRSSYGQDPAGVERMADERATITWTGTLLALS